MPHKLLQLLDCLTLQFLFFWARHGVAPAAGAIVWAAVYTTIGMAIVTAWLTGPTGRIVIILVAAALVAFIVLRRLGRQP